MLGVDLLAQMIDHHVDDSRPGIEVIAPRVFCNQRAAHDAAAVSHQILENGVLLRSQLDQLAAPTYLPRALIELQIADRELVRSERLRTTRECLHPREQFLEGERLRDVIVSASP